MQIPQHALLDDLIDYAIMERNHSCQEFGENDYWDRKLTEILKSFDREVVIVDEEMKVTKLDVQQE